MDADRLEHVETIAKKLLTNLKVAYKRLYQNEHYAKNDELIQQAETILGGSENDIDSAS